MSGSQVDQGYNDGFAVTPSDTAGSNPGGVVGRVLYVGGAGDVSLVTADGNPLFFKAVQAGQILPIAFKQVNATTGGTTTATQLVGLL